jgi:hypothetical protein
MSSFFEDDEGYIVFSMNEDFKNEDFKNEDFKNEDFKNDDKTKNNTEHDNYIKTTGTPYTFVKDCVEGSQSDRFSYIKCLDLTDRIKFQNYTACCIGVSKSKCETFSKGTIKMSSWKLVMDKINPDTTYKLWRYNYDNEFLYNSIPNFKETPTGSNHILIYQVDGNKNSKIVNLLYHNQKLEVIPHYFLSPYGSSSGSLAYDLHDLTDNSYDNYNIPFWNLTSY